MALPTSSPLVCNYIKQTLYQPIICLTDITLSENDIDALFVVRGEYFSSYNLTNLKAKPESISKTTDINEHTRFVTGGHEEFLELQDKRSNVHEVIYDDDYDGMIIQQSSRGADLGKITEHMDRDCCFMEIEVMYDRPVTVVYADYGMGKTTFLKQVVTTIKSTSSEADTIFLNDMNLRQFFAKFKVRNTKNFIEFFDIDINHDNIHLFIDNFDNMSDSKEVIAIMHEVHLTYKNIKIWCSCTKLSTKTELESKFGAFVSHLSPIKKEFQMKYLKEIWNIQNSDFDSYINEILDLCNKNYWKKFIDAEFSELKYDFTSFPLHLKMIAGKFNPFEKNVPSEISILEIYEHFIESTYNVENLDESAAIKLSENLNILPTSEHTFNESSIVNFLAAKWFSKNIKQYRKEFKQLFMSNSSNWQFVYFFNRFICRDSQLFTSVLNRDLESVKSICSNLNNSLSLFTDSIGRTVLHYSEDVDITEILIQNGARFDVKDNVFEWTALRLMDYNCNLKILNLYLKNNADVTDFHITLDLNNVELSERFKLAINQKLIYYVKFLCEFCSDLNISSRNIFDVMWEFPEESIMMILKLVKKIDKFYVNLCDQTALFIAVEKNHMEAVKYMIHNLKFDIHHICWGNNCTLLHCAAEYGYIEMAKYLLELGLDINAVDDTNTNAFITCCRSNQLEMLKFLVEQGIKTDICLTWGETPLKIACNSGSTDVAKYLFKNAGILNLKVDKDSCLHGAVDSSNLELVQLILAEYDIDINSKREDSNSVLHIACMRDNLEIVKLVIEAGADVNAIDDSGCTPLFLSHYSNNTDIVKLLFEKGANFLHVNDIGESALHYFAAELSYSIHRDGVNNYKDNIEFLLDKGVDINLKSSEGHTALHVACLNYNLKIVKVLVDKGADINAVNSSGNTPLDEAKRGCQTDIIEYLTLKGAISNK